MIKIPLRYSSDSAEQQFNKLTSTWIWTKLESRLIKVGKVVES